MTMNKRFAEMTCLVLLILALGAITARADWPHIVQSADGAPVSYEVCGTGEPTLIFVHGWNCDSRYWREQVPYFSGKHRVILIGHSMGGSVIAEAARLLPDRVVGLIGVDTLENVEYPLTQEELTKMVTPLQENFQTGSREFVGQMISTGDHVGACP
jgi:pimeloyl-ACP methyl ester carboxylesterase